MSTRRKLEQPTWVAQRVLPGMGEYAEEVALAKNGETPLTIPEQINKLHRGIRKSLRKSVDHAIKIGKLLTEKKECLGHGEWLPWLQRNIEFDQKHEFASTE